MKCKKRFYHAIYSKNFQDSCFHFYNDIAQKLDALLFVSVYSFSMKRIFITTTTAFYRMICGHHFFSWNLIKLFHAIHHPQNNLKQIEKIQYINCTVLFKINRTLRFAYKTYINNIKDVVLIFQKGPFFFEGRVKVHSHRM